MLIYRKPLVLKSFRVHHLGVEFQALIDQVERMIQIEMDSQRYFFYLSFISIYIIVNSELLTMDSRLKDNLSAIFYK